MIRLNSTPLVAVLMVLALGALGVLAPHVNAAGGPPRSVFVAWPEEVPVPNPSISMRRTAGGGWVLDIKAEGFTFSDICQTVSGPQTSGHAHVYVGEQKIATAFAPRVWLDDLPAGTHEIRVVFRAQDHRALVGPDGMIFAATTLDTGAALAR